ncbi:MAG: beta-galactosidase [Kofleriaceae bacterium]|nr:beta-galactosidase [Kofleriaceae bacterium]
MEAPVRTGWDDHGLVVGGAAVPLLAGAMHYWRVAPRHWDACVRALADLGVRQVETYVPWSVHETAPGRFDWTGARDLGRFLDVVAAAGLGAVLRPGPHCNAELTGFGFPDRILRDPTMQARNGHGAPVWMPAPPQAFPVPSYASAAFRAEVAGWFAAFAEVVAPRLAPDGPVVAIGVDNEAQQFFRLGAFDHDYHPDAIAWWHEAGGEGEPPRRWDVDDEAAQARAVDWVRFKDVYTARALGELAGALDDVGLGGVARFHNLPPGEPWWSDAPRIADAIRGPVGIDLYAGRRDLPMIKRRALHLVGSSSVPLAPEVGVGFFPWLPPIDPDGQREAMLGLLAWGVRGLNVYMAVARERWYGAAIGDDGTPGPAAAWLRPVLRALGEVDWSHLRRPAEVAVVVSRADARWGLASSLIDPVTPVVAEALGLGPAGAAELGRDAGAVRHRRWVAAAQHALELAQVPYVLVDEGCDVERLASFRALVVPTFDRVDAALLTKLRQVAERKRIVVMGPDAPSRDELGRPLADATLPRRAGMMRAASVDDVAGLAEDLAGLVDPVEAWTVARGADVDCAAHVDAAGAARVVFVVNRGGRTAQAVVRTPGPLHLRDVVTGEPVRGDDSIELEVPGHAVRMLRVE